MLATARKLSLGEWEAPVQVADGVACWIREKTNHLRVDLPTLPAKIWKVVDQALTSVVVITLVAPIVWRLPPARSILSSRVVWLSETFLAFPVRRLRDTLTGIFPPIWTTFGYGLKSQINWTQILTGSVLEEIVFRSCIQSFLLTEVPRRLLRKIAPSYEYVVDHKIARVARIVFSSLLFALTHIVRYGHLPGMLLIQFFWGLYWSHAREQGTSIAELSAVHFTYNAILILLSGGL